MTTSPTLVFIHGAGSNSGFWREQRIAFPHALYPDLPGHTEARDRSDAWEGLRSIDDYADWVERYVEERSLHSVILNGHSMGGAITLTLGMRRPAWLKALVLTSTGARLRVLPRLLDLLRTDYAAAVDLILERSFAPYHAPLSYAQRATLNGARRQLLRTPRHITLADYEACDRFDILPYLSQITLPTLCTAGAQDAMTPPGYSQYLHAHLPHSRLEIIKGAGHMLPIEQPDAYSQALQLFVSGLAV